MNIRIKIDRVAAIRAGQCRWGTGNLWIKGGDLTQAERDELATAPEKGGAIDLTSANPDMDLVLVHERHYIPGEPAPETPVLEPYPELAEVSDPGLALEAVRSIIATRIHNRGLLDAHNAQATAYLARHKALAEEAAQRYIAAAMDVPIEEFRGARKEYVSARGRWVPLPGLPSIEAHNGDLDLARSHTDVWSEIKRALAEQLEQSRALIEAEQCAIDNAAVEAEAAAREEEAKALALRTEQIAAWVRDNGNENQQARFKRNLLPEDEVIDAIREQAYADLESFPRYRKIRGNELPHTDECYQEYALDCATDDATALTAAEFEVGQRIEAVCPGAVFEYVAHRCTCEHCEATLERRSLRVKITVGVFTFTREYALEDEATEEAAT